MYHPSKHCNCMADEIKCKTKKPSCTNHFSFIFSFSCTSKSKSSIHTHKPKHQQMHDTVTPQPTPTNYHLRPSLSTRPLTLPRSNPLPFTERPLHPLPRKPLQIINTLPISTLRKPFLPPKPILGIFLLAFPISISFSTTSAFFIAPFGSLAPLFSVWTLPAGGGAFFAFSAVFF